MLFSAWFCPFLHILNLRLDQTGNADLRTDLDFAGSHLGIVTVFADDSGLFHNAVPTLISGSVVTQNIQRHFAGVEAFLTSLCVGFFVFLADLVLESTALHVFVEALIGSDCFVHFIFPPPRLLPGWYSSRSAELSDIRDSSCRHRSWSAGQ